PRYRRSPPRGTGPLWGWISREARNTRRSRWRRAGLPGADCAARPEELELYRKSQSWRKSFLTEQYAGLTAYSQATATADTAAKRIRGRSSAHPRASWHKQPCCQWRLLH